MGTFSEEAKKYWDTFPDSIKGHIIYSVSCEKCRITSIADFSGKIEGDFLVLEGFCKKCYREVKLKISII